MTEWEGRLLHCDLLALPSFNHVRKKWHHHRSVVLPSLCSCVCVCFCKCPALEDLNLLDRVCSALLDINNPPPIWLVKRTNVLLWKRLLVARVIAFVRLSRPLPSCTMLSHWLGLHIREWVLDNMALKYANIHFDYLAATQRGQGKGQSKRGGKRMRQKGDTRVNEKLQGPRLVQWVSPIVFNHTNTRMWMKNVVFADYLLQSLF